MKFLHTMSADLSFLDVRKRVSPLLNCFETCAFRGRTRATAYPRRRCGPILRSGWRRPQGPSVARCGAVGTNIEPSV
jgi:hypothetical protein